MKQLITVFFSVTVIAFLAACASAEQKTADGLQIQVGPTILPTTPKAVKDAVNKAPKDVLVGIGFAKSDNIAMSLQFAEFRAATDISRQVNLVTTEIVRYYVETSKTDPSKEELFRETIKIQLSQSTLQGASPIFRYQDKDGGWWFVSTIDKSAVADQLTAAQDPAKAEVPEMADFDAPELLNSAVFVNK